MKSKQQKIKEILEITEGTVGREKKYRMPALFLIKEGDEIPAEFIPGDILLYGPGETLEN